MKINFILIITLIFLQSCSENNYNTVDLKLNKLSNSLNNADPQILNDGNPSELSYKNIRNQVLQAKCLNCHSEKGGNRGHLNLETYQSIFTNKDQIREEVLTKKMPKKSVEPMTDDQIKLIVNWIDAGTNEFVTSEPLPQVVPPALPILETPEVPEDDPPSTEPVDLANMNFASVMKLVIEPKCLKCHNSGAKNGIELVTFADLLFQKNDIKKDVRSGDMPRKDALTDYEKKLILDWIAADMPELKAN